MAAEGGRRGDAGGLLGSESADRPGQRRRLGPGLDGSQIGQQVVRHRALARRVAAQHEEQEGGTRRDDALGLQPPEALADFRGIADVLRTEESGGGKEGGITCMTRWSREY